MSGSFVNRLGDSPEEGIKAPVVKVTDADIPLSGLITGVTAGQRVLVAAQTDTTENGIYNASESAWSRSTDFNAANDTVNGVLVLDSSTGDIYQAVFTGAWDPDVTEITFRNVIRLGEVVSEEFVRKTGDTMTGQLNWVDADGELRMQTIVGSVANGLRVFSPGGGAIKISMFTLDSSSTFTLAGDGVIGFTGAEQDASQQRFIIQGSGSERKMVLGNPWPDDPAAYGYDHLQLYFERDADTSTPFFVAKSADVIQAQIDGSGGAVFTDQVSLWDFETSNTSAYGMYATSDLPGAEVALVISPVVSDPLDPETTYTYTGEVYIETISVVDPLALNRFTFRADGQLILPQQPTDDMSAITKSWAIANLGGGAGTLPVGSLGQVMWHDGTQWEAVSLTGFKFDENGIFEAGPTSTVREHFNLMDRDGTLWDIMDISLLGAGTHELVVAHQNMDTPSAITLVSNTGTIDDQNRWYFLPNGDFRAPGDIKIDSQGSNAGSFEIRNYEAGGEAWFGMYVTNDLPPGNTDDGLFILQPAYESGSGAPEWFSGGIRLITNSTSGSNAGINAWDFLSNGDFVAPGDIKIDSQGSNAGSFEIRNYESGGSDAWFGMYVTNDLPVENTDDGMLIIQPAYESGSGSEEWYSGGIRLITNPTSGNSDNLNIWNFLSNGDFVAPGDIIIDSTGPNSGSFEIRNYEQTGKVGWWGMYATNAVVEDSMLILQPAHETGPGAGEFNSGAFRVITNPTAASTDDLHAFDFGSNGSFTVPGDLIIRPDLTSNGGSMCIRSYQIETDFWYQMYVTNAAIDSAEASLIIEPTNPEGVLNTGNVRITTRDASVHSFDFAKNGNLTVPNDLLIASDSVNGGSLGIRSYNGGLKWWQMYVGNNVLDGAEATLLIEPVNPAGGSNTGNVRITVREGSTNRSFTFEKNGDLTVPRVINMSSSVSGGLYWGSNQNVAANNGGIFIDSTIKCTFKSGVHSMVVDSSGLTTGTTTQIAITPAAPTAANHAARKSYVDTAVSDARLKENLRDTSDGLDAVMQLRPIRFDYVDSNQKRGYHKQRYGLLAQEVQKVLPGAVHILASDADENGRSISGENYLGLDLAELVPVLINAIQELNRKVDALTVR